MKNTLKRLFVIVTFIAILYSAVSCNLPFKLVANTPEPDTPLQSATPPPPGLTQSPSELMPTATPEAGAILPITGTVMRWIDLSDFVYIPGGEYTIGSTEVEPSDHAPAHVVTLNGFWIHQGEVTNQQYAACVADGKCSAPFVETGVPYWYSQPSRVNAPVVGVTWSQAVEYCNYIEARLPSEAEWEAAARGLEAKTYPWGEDDPTCDLLNYDDCLDPSEPKDIRSYNNGASDFEVMDMSGNVAEWVNDWYAEDYYASSPTEDPQGPLEGTLKVFRGGSYPSDAAEVSPVARFTARPEEHAADRGFRCVLTGKYTDSSSTSQVPRPCEVLPVSRSQPEVQPTFTPIPCEPAYIRGNCYLNNQGNPITSLYIEQHNCQSNILTAFSSTSIDDLLCAELDDTGTMKAYSCGGFNIFQGSTVDLSYCHQYSVTIDLVCPTGYEFEPYSKFCIPSGPWLPDPPCPFGYVQDGDLCLPDIELHDGCPVGFHYALILTGPDSYEELCLPLEPCLQPNATIPCEPTVCPQGQTYDSANNCCSNPAKLLQVCPAGLTIQTDPLTQQSVCTLPDMVSVLCETRNVTMGYCPTPTPTATATPRELTCADYTTSSECLAHYCKWNKLGYCY